jgi:hypothetical protein
MTDLLEVAIDAHGGMKRWRVVRTIDMIEAVVRLHTASDIGDVVHPTQQQVRTEIEFLNLGVRGDAPVFVILLMPVQIARHEATKWDALPLTYFIGY